MGDRKPILCVDFDGVLHSYTSGWQGASVCPDPIVPGAASFLAEAVTQFRVAIYSSRSGQLLGIEAMQLWLRSQLYKTMDRRDADELFAKLEWPTEKPSALVTLDDRAVTFTGFFPDVSELRAFKTWQQDL